MPAGRSVNANTSIPFAGGPFASLNVHYCVVATLVICLTAAATGVALTPPGVDA